MDIATIWYELGDDKRLPRAALAAAGDHRDALIPRFVDLIERRPARGHASYGDETRIFYGFHLLAEWRAHAAYPAMAQLLHGDADPLDELFGDCLTETVYRVMATVFDGDPQPLQDLCLDRRLNEFTRSGMFSALAMAVGHGRLERERFVAFLKDAYYRMPKREGSFVWNGWLEAVASLAIVELRPLAETALARHYVDATVYDRDHFDEEFARHEAAGRADIAGGTEHTRLWTDTLGEFSTWPGFAEPSSTPSRSYSEPPVARPPLAIERDRVVAKPEPYFGHVGRNAVCPCGSGQKFKRCHGR